MDKILITIDKELGVAGGPYFLGRLHFLHLRLSFIFNKSRCFFDISQFVTFHLNFYICLQFKLFYSTFALPVCSILSSYITLSFLINTLGAELSLVDVMFAPFLERMAASLPYFKGFLSRTPKYVTATNLHMLGNGFFFTV